MTVQRVVILWLLLCCPIIANAAFNSWQAFNASVAVVCNFATGQATGVGAGTCATTPIVCDGSTDITPAFDSLLNWLNNTWQPAHPGLLAEVDLPSGTCIAKSGTAVQPPLVAVGAWLTYGAKKLRIRGNSTVLTYSGAGQYLFGGVGVCHRGLTDGNGCSARINTALAGATSVTLTPASFGAGYISRFAVGASVIVAGYALQGDVSYPPNPFYYTYAKITAVNGATGVITLDTPLRSKLEATWPEYYNGSNGEADLGGPGTIYALDSGWDTEVEFNTITFDFPSFQISNAGRSITYRNTVFTSGQPCAPPSQNSIWQLIGSNWSDCSIEVDKAIVSATVDSSALRGLQFQSASVDVFRFNSSTISDILGTPKYIEITGGSVVSSLEVGATSYGRSDEVVCSSSTIGSFSAHGILEKGPSDAGVNSGFSMSGGVISIPSTYVAGTARWAVPGTNLFWSGAYFSETVFHVVDVTCSGDCTSNTGHMQVTTDLAGGFPGVPLTSGMLYIQTHPAPKFTATSCPGLEFAAGAPAQAPLYSYTTATYSGTQIGTQSAATNGTFIWGVPTSLRWNVTAAYTGAGLSLHALSAFDNYPTVDTVTYATSTYGPTINLKQTGDRVATPSGVTCNGSGGACSGDSLSAPGATAWFPQAYAIAGSADISGSCSSSPSAGCPTVAITLQANQGVVNPFAMDESDWGWLIGDNDNANWRQAM